jgi:hypothetical protein
METKRMESDSLAKIAEALSKAQGQMKPAAKDSVNPHFKSTYADLAACWAAIREPLAANGLAVTQRLSTDANGVRVETMLLHISGEFLRDDFWLPVSQKTPQGYASAITYARRYSLAAIVGLSADTPDDDGNAASISPNGFSVTSRPAPVPAAKAPQTAPMAAPPVPAQSAASAAPVAGHGVVVPYGKNKGVAISVLPTKSVEFYRQKAMEELADDSKAAYHAKTREWLQHLEAELAVRAEPEQN